MPNFQITNLHGGFWNESDKESFIKRGWKDNPNFAQDKALYAFQAYDDDGYLYFTGICDDDWDNVFDCLMYDSGISRVVFFDRITRKRIDEIS